ncbi:MAG: DUF1294 domain-containing protein [Acutalibacteraceae bacterium]|nr:DUF1294 domain-containing protein [Acutalibacteraceae bacterium]
MLKFSILIILFYFMVINIISVIVTILDKLKAKYNKWRIPEKTLFILSAIGGAVGMYITMHLIHHKTKKMRFMVGIPLIFFAELLIAVLLLFMFR